MTTSNLQINDIVLYLKPPQMSSNASFGGLFVAPAAVLLFAQTSVVENAGDCWNPPNPLLDTGCVPKPVFPCGCCGCCGVAETKFPQALL